MKNQQNVLFVIIDQLRADCVFGALAQHVDMPNLRSLMKDAVTFKQHYSVTNPCGPARASILTGQYAMNHRSVRNGTPMAHHIPNIAREMRKAGYEPMLFGYTDTSLDPNFYHQNDPAIKEYEQILPGFSEMVEMRLETSYPWRAYLKSKGYELPDYQDFYIPKSAAGQKPQLDDPAFYEAKHSDTAFLTDKTIEALSVRCDENWFAHVTYIRPHPPLVAPEPYNKMYRECGIPTPLRQKDLATEAKVHPFIESYINQNKTGYFLYCDPDGFDKDNPEHVKTARSVYMGLATEVDHHVGRLVEFLKQSGQYDNTLIVIQADHGEMLGDHYMWGKQTIFDAAFHIPLIIRDPNATKMHGDNVNAFTESIDITPTILDWVGLTPPRSMNGKSLKPFLNGNTPTHWRQHVYFELELGEPAKPTAYQSSFGLELRDANVAILREDRYKLIHFNGGIAPLLYDLSNDPNEMKNLAQDQHYAKIMLKMTQKLLNHRMTHANPSLSDMMVSSEGVINFP